MSDIYDHVGVRGRIHYVLTDEKGNVKQEDTVSNVVTELHDALIADRLAGGADPLFTHMHCGTGTGQTAASTDLAAEIAVNRTAVTSSTQGAGAADNDVVVVCTFGAGVCTGTITEVGIFSDEPSANMKCYYGPGAGTFTVTKAAGDTLTVTWTITYGAS